MKYKEYIGQVVYDSQARILHGRVLGLKDVITFQGRNIDEIEQAFKDSVDDYLEWCQKLGEEPEKPFSGNIRLRMSPQLHAQLAYQAASSNVSLNSFILGKLHK